jgi:hypothetical protein
MSMAVLQDEQNRYNPRRFDPFYRVFKWYKHIESDTERQLTLRLANLLQWIDCEVEKKIATKNYQPLQAVELTKQTIEQIMNTNIKESTIPEEITESVTLVKKTKELNQRLYALYRLREKLYSPNKEIDGQEYMKTRLKEGVEIAKFIFYFSRLPPKLEAVVTFMMKKANVCDSLLDFNRDKKALDIKLGDQTLLPKAYKNKTSFYMEGIKALFFQ